MKRCPQCGASVEEADHFCAACGGALTPGKGTSAPADPLLGRTIGGAYLLQEPLGVGGMGKVYKGVQNMLGRTVAVKVIHPHLLGDEQTVARFYNEARAASRLNHPDSVGIIDFGRTDDGMLYLVMEYLAGKDLATVLAEEGPLPFKRIARILRHVCSALGEAHALGVIHRDLKPENIIVQKSRKGDESVKVVDFGLATIVGPGNSSITTPGLVCGTPDYMSPEQGRGDQLDARTDLYSMGVMLFEMLTDRLPFIDETPTKVVLRHIHDAVPDPRLVAPLRDVPTAFAELAIKALQKDPGERFQSADEMDEALRKAEHALAVRASGAGVECSTCGHANPVGVRFCGECGTRLTATFTVPPEARVPSGPPKGSMAPPPMGRRALIGRDPELDELARLRMLAMERKVWMRVVGEAGVGKTRLLNEFGLRAQTIGDCVVSAGPHPSGAPVPYHAARTLLISLLGIDASRLSDPEIRVLFPDALSRAGLEEVNDPKGLVGLPGASRAGAVAATMGIALKVAATRTSSRLVVVVVDDWLRVDGLSRQVLLRLLDVEGSTSLMLVTSSSSSRDLPAHPVATTLALRGLDPDHAQQFLTGTLPPPRPFGRETEPEVRMLLPLYLEQVEALGPSSLEDTLPPRLADVVMARLERVDVSSRRLLQAIAVLGDSAPLPWLRELAPANELATLDKIARLNLLYVNGDRVEIVHPFIRELIEASIPAEARKELHARALQVASSHGAPLEVRAEHAYKAAEGLSALLLLERMGDAAVLHGDHGTAVLAFKRGLDLARRELLLSGDESLEGALVTFSRKLGEALAASGDLAGADGVLREALELAGPKNKERARMLLALGRIAALRDRRRDAHRLLGQAVEVAASLGDARCEAEAHLSTARLRRVESDAGGASSEYRRASELLAIERNAEASLAMVEHEHAEALLEQDDKDVAVALLRAADKRAQAINSPAIGARVAGTLALASDPAKSSELLKAAQRMAEDAGDADTAARWRAAALR